MLLHGKVETPEIVYWNKVTQLPFVLAYMGVLPVILNDLVYILIHLFPVGAFKFEKNSTCFIRAVLFKYSIIFHCKLRH